MVLADNILGPKEVGYGETQGTSSAVEKNTIKNGTFDEVASHELGHNLGLDHTKGGLMNETIGNGQSGIYAGQLKQIYGSSIVLPQGKTTLYNGPDNKKDAKDFVRKYKID